MQNLQKCKTNRPVMANCHFAMTIGFNFHHFFNFPKSAKSET